jgi:hypothetical protein
VEPNGSQCVARASARAMQLEGLLGDTSGQDSGIQPLQGIASHEGELK